MRYDDYVESACKALGAGDTDKAKTLAMLAIADRLDRLCALQSGGGEKPPAVKFTYAKGTSAAPPRW